mgnify:CR=1 FL=1
MTIDKLITRIDKLEILFSEHEYTVESLNTVVIRQVKEIDRLNDTIELLKHQIREFKKQIPESSIVDEKPPHY